MAALNRLTDVRFSRGKLGLWVGAEGPCFAQLDERLHICATWCACQTAGRRGVRAGLWLRPPAGVRRVHQARAA